MSAFVTDFPPSGSSTGAAALTRTTRRLRGTTEPDDSAQLVVPKGCDLVAGTFLIFRWQDEYCVLQTNLTLYCWGRRRSGAIEHVLEKYGWTHSAQLHRVNSALVSEELWLWLKGLFVIVHRLFDEKETGETVGKIHWLNIVQCRLAYDLLHRECSHYRRNLYPAGNALAVYLKQHGIEVDDWSHSTDADAALPGDEVVHATPPSSGSATSATSQLANDIAARAPALTEREWLSDVHIANLMFLLLHGQLALPLEMRDHFQCMYPMTDALFVQMLQQPEPGSLLTHAKMGHVTLAFINPNNNHWRVIIFDGIQQQVVLFDPLGTSLHPSIVSAVRDFVGPTYRILDLQCCLQAESWNCGVWSLYIASRYISAVVEHLTSALPADGDIQATLRDGGSEYVVLDEHTSAAQRRMNQTFAGELRNQYSELLTGAESSGRLLYSTSALDNNDVVDPRRQRVVQAGTAVPVARRRNYRTISEQVWIDLTDDVGEEAMEQSYDDLCDHFIEFRDDNIDNPSAATLKYSLPAKLQTETLRAQIEQFRGYRRERFSLFRRGPLVEETTISGNISALLRFLGYLQYEQGAALDGAPLDMSVFALPHINTLVLSYVEWLERRRGKKKRQVPGPSGPSGKTVFQSVSCATVANYLNGLVSIVKYQLRNDLHLRDTLLDQLHNLRSQAESYSMTQKRFEKVHPEWCSWQDLQVARERCRAAFDQLPRIEDDNSVSQPKQRKAYLLHLREVCLLSLYTICPPPRCSIIRLLEWDKTLVQVTDASDAADGGWMLDLTDLSHAATRHKTHKRKGAMQMPLPKMLYPYLTQLRRMLPQQPDPVFPSGLASGRAPSSARRVLFPVPMDPTSFSVFVKQTVQKYTEGGRAPNPSLLRSIFTTWLYGIRYDVEDAFLQQIKASSAQWKAHSEQVASTVYNKELVYQKKEFALLLQFCEKYAERFAHDRGDGEGSMMDEEKAEPVFRPVERRGRSRSTADLAGLTVPGTSSRRKRSKRDEGQSFVVEALVDIRTEGKTGERQVLVKWEGYYRRTWEPYGSIQQQLPGMVESLERELRGGHRGAGDDRHNDDEAQALETFVASYIRDQGIDASYRWLPDGLNALEHAATNHAPPVKETADHLRRCIMKRVGGL